MTAQRGERLAHSRKGWSTEDRGLLLASFGSMSPAQLVQRLGRSWYQITTYARGELGLQVRDYYTSRARLLKRLGVCPAILRRAQGALAISPKLPGSNSRGRIYYTERQVERLTAYVLDEERHARHIGLGGRIMPRWSYKYARCQGCGTRGKEPRQRHRARGLCVRCYNKAVAPANFAKWKAKQAAAQAAQADLVRQPGQAL